MEKEWVRHRSTKLSSRKFRLWRLWSVVPSSVVKSDPCHLWIIVDSRRSKVKSMASALFDH
jgi:hypothetical protein